RCLERTCPCLKDRAVAEFQTLKIESLSSHLALLTLNRPEAANALNTQMGRDLMDYFEGVALSSQNLRCIIVSGSGSKVFCAGGDLKERNGMTDEAWREQHVLFERMFRAILDCPVPVIAAVNGAAYG